MANSSEPSLLDRLIAAYQNALDARIADVGHHSAEERIGLRAAVSTFRHELERLGIVSLPVVELDERYRGPFWHSASHRADHWTCAVCLSIQPTDAVCHCKTLPRVELTEWGVKETMDVQSDMKWRPITEASDHVRDAAQVTTMIVGKARARLYFGPDCSIYALWNGGAAGTPATLWCQLPDMPIAAHLSTPGVRSDGGPDLPKLPDLPRGPMAEPVYNSDGSTAFYRVPSSQLGSWGAQQAKKRPANFESLPGDEQWAIDKRLGILDWDGT